MGGATPSTSSSRTRSTRSSSPTGSASTTRGRSSTTSSRSTPTPRPPRSSWPRPASARRTSVSATASSSSRRTTRRGSPSGSPRSTCVSKGRVEMGIGEASSVTELHPFDRRFRDKRAVWEDGVKCVLPMFTEEGWEYHGEYVRLPAAQRRAEAAAEAASAAVGGVQPARHDRDGGRRGMGALGFQFVSAEAAQAWVNAYYNAYTKHLDKLCDYQTNPNIAVVSAVHVLADTDEEAQRRGRGLDVLPVRVRLLQHARPRRSGHCEPVGGVPRLEGDAEGSGARPSARAHRLARHRSADGSARSRSRTSTR